MGSSIADFPARAIRASGPETVVRETLTRVVAAPGGFWVHVDADVLDPAVMPAVDSPLPGGFGVAELTELARPLATNPVARGLQLTIYDPTLDPEARGATVLVDLLHTLVGDETNRV